MFFFHGGVLLFPLINIILMSNWRQLFSDSPLSSTLRKQVLCLICNKLLINRPSTWGTLKKHAESHLANGQNINDIQLRQMPSVNTASPIKKRIPLNRDWMTQFDILKFKMNGDKQVKCLICGLILMQTNKSSSSLKRHMEKHRKGEMLDLKSLPLPYSSRIFWSIKKHRKSDNKNQYRVEFKTCPKIKGWISEETLTRLQNNLGIVELPANHHLVAKSKLKRDTCHGPEILVELNTKPVIYSWLSKEIVRKIKTEGKLN